MKLIVALGNPGPQYVKTRHNAGFLALDHFLTTAFAEPLPAEDAFDSLIMRGSIAGEQCLFAYPQTYMNDSGRAVAAIMHFYKIPIDDLIVLHDEVDLPLGTTRIARNSNPAGHNGIKSIIAHLGTMDFRRIRIGIESRIENRIPPTDAFVLQPFSDTELKQLPFDKIDHELKEEIHKK